MAIDYSGVFPCKVRESLSESDLLQMKRAKNQAKYAVLQMRKDPDIDKSKPESEWTIKAITVGPEGKRSVDIRIGDLLEQSAPLEKLSVHCKNCTANVLGIEFGCGGAIGYPISRKTENWLLSRLPKKLDSKAGILLTRAIADFDYNGLAIDGNRNRKDLFESDVPLIREWGGIFSEKTKISSSQILQMIFTVGTLQPAHAKLVAYFVGFLNDNFEIVRNISNKLIPNDENGINQFKLFFSVLAMAGNNNCPVFINA
jgi:hypothetical protein